MDDFAKIAVTADLPPNGLLLIEVEDERIVLANVDGQYYAVTDVCTHADCPCPMAGWREMCWSAPATRASST